MVVDNFSSTFYAIDEKLRSLYPQKVENIENLRKNSHEKILEALGADVKANNITILWVKCLSESSFVWAQFLLIKSTTHST